MSTRGRQLIEMVEEVETILGPGLWAAFLAMHYDAWSHIKNLAEALDLLAPLESPETIRAWLLGTDDATGLTPIALFATLPEEALDSARCFAAYG